MTHRLHLHIKRVDRMTQVDHFELRTAVDEPAQGTVSLTRAPGSRSESPLDLIGRPVRITLDDRPIFEGDVVAVEEMTARVLLHIRSRLGRLLDGASPGRWYRGRFADALGLLLEPAQVSATHEGRARTRERDWWLATRQSLFAGVVRLHREAGLACLDDGVAVRAVGQTRGQPTVIDDQSVALGEMRVRTRAVSGQATRIAYDSTHDRMLRVSARGKADDPRLSPALAGIGHLGEPVSVRWASAGSDWERLEDQAELDAEARLGEAVCLSVKVLGLYLRLGEHFELPSAPRRSQGAWRVHRSTLIYHADQIENRIEARPADTSLAGPPPNSDASPRIIAARVVDVRDPSHLARVKVVQLAEPEGAAIWARVAQPAHGSDHGVFALPREGDEVLVLTEQGRPDAAVVIGGMLHGGEMPPLTTENGVRDRWLLRDGPTSIHAMLEPGRERIEVRTARTRLVVDEVGDDAPPQLRVEVPGRVRIEADELMLDVRRLVVAASADIDIEAGGDLRMHSEKTAEFSSTGDSLFNGASWKVRARDELALLADKTVEVHGVSRTDIVGDEVHVTTGGG